MQNEPKSPQLNPDRPATGSDNASAHDSSVQNEPNPAQINDVGARLRSSLAQRIWQIEPNRFNRLCAIAALAFLVVTIVARLVLSRSDQDFPQYYMGGVVARLGIWDELYPIPKPGATRNPGFIEDSTMKPRYAAEMKARVPSGDGVRYMQPPPFALLLWPLSFLPYRVAYVLWNLGLMLCAWGVSVQAGWIYRICMNRSTHGAGIVTLLIAVSPAAHRWVRVMNISPLLGVLIGVAVIGMVRNRPVHGALATWLAGLAKYATGVFVPLYVALRQWRALAWLVGVSVASLLISIAVMGRGVFDEYLHVIAPTLKNPNTLVGNQALQGCIARIIHGTHATQQLEEFQRSLGGRPLIPRPVLIVLTVAQLATLATILWLMFRRWKLGPRFWHERAPMIFAAASALICWLLIFSPMYWEHYTAYLAPLWGWLAWEATRSRARMVLAIAVAVLCYVPWPIVINDLPEPLGSHILWATMIMLGVAIDRMWRETRAAGSDLV